MRELPFQLNTDVPHSSYAIFHRENIDETECLAEFRVQKQVIPVLANVRQLPVNMCCPQRTIYDTTESLCMLLRSRVFLSLPLLIQIWSELCMITNKVPDFPLALYQKLWIIELVQPFLDWLPDFAAIWTAFLELKQFASNHFTQRENVMVICPFHWKLFLVAIFTLEAKKFQK